MSAGSPRVPVLPVGTRVALGTPGSPWFPTLTLGTVVSEPTATLRFVRLDCDGAARLLPAGYLLALGEA